MLRTGFPAVSRTESAGPALSSKCTAPGGECTPLIGSVLASLGGVGFTPVHIHHRHLLLLLHSTSISARTPVHIHHRYLLLLLHSTFISILRRFHPCPHPPSPSIIIITSLYIYFYTASVSPSSTSTIAIYYYY